MDNKKGILIGLLPLICASFLLSQSLVEIAKKEKERRAKLKDTSSKVMTNADLARIKRSPALTVTRAYTPTIESTAPRATEIPTTRARSPEIDRGNQSGLGELEDKAKKADEYVELLTLKMNGLWQKFYSFEDWTLRDEIQREMVETFEKLQKAQQDVEKAKGELKSQQSRKKR